MKKKENLYECVSYNKNFLTGDAFYDQKLKEDTGIKGKVKLELFDARSNEKLQEAYTENLIPDLYFRDTFLRTFVHGIMGTGSTRSTNNYFWFDYLYLTDHDKPENVNEHRIMGNVIAFAHRNTTYSGNDPRRGTINRAETKLQVTDNKIKLNFVFDFPTHAANGRIESIYWAEADIDNKDYFYQGPALFGRGSSDSDISIDSVATPRRYYVVNVLFANARSIKFTSPTKGWVLVDAKSTTITQSSFLQFPENLKGHWLMLPFDLNTDDFVLWDQAVRLLNADGMPLTIDNNHSIRKFDGLSRVCPYLQPDGNLVFIGYYIYTPSSDNMLRIYKWSKVGVLLSYIDINLSQNFKDMDYNIPFTYRSILEDGIFLDGCIDIVGTTHRTEEQFNEQVYTNRWIRIDALGNKVQDMNIKPKIGNSMWFGTRGMDSGNIERRSRISSFFRSSNRIYLYYTGLQGGSGFYQVITPQGNLLEPDRMYFGYTNSSNIVQYNILGTDRWISRIHGGNYQLMIQALLTSRPIGAHTKLAQPVEKTEANTMKVQYMFEIDLINYGEDYY